MRYINVSVYKFLELDASRLPELREKFKAEALRLELKGTVLLASEGVNGFFSGTPENVQAYKQFFCETLGTQDFPFKDSPSDRQPFTRMLVKIKKEIITMGVPEINPARFTGKRVKPSELKQWLDEGKDILVLDTRNDYEVRIGTFKTAMRMDLQTFRQFPELVRKLPAEAKKRTVVTFCTGGIRCEKATAFMANEGFEDVYQLDGGILKYFEEVGAEHYEGECFVFDHRVAVDPTLHESGAVLCYNCQMPVTVEEQKSSAYVKNVSCPHCIEGKKVPHKEQIALEILAKQRDTKSDAAH